MGVYIGSKTPPEIAVSILAEVVAAKNGVVVPHDMLVAPAKDLLARIDAPEGSGISCVPAGND